MKTFCSRSAPESSSHRSVPAAAVEARIGSQPPGGALADLVANSPYMIAQRRVLEDLLSCKDGQDRPLPRDLPPVQRKLEDARAYITSNNMAIDATKKSWALRAAIMAFARKHPEEALLRGLVAAWNKGYADNTNWRIDLDVVPSSARPQGSAGTTSPANATSSSSSA